MRAKVPVCMLLSVVLIAATAGCVAPPPGPSAPVAETAAAPTANTATTVEEAASPEPPASQPTAPQAEARSAAAAIEPEPPPATATQPPPPTEAPAEEPPPTVAPTEEPPPTEAPAQPTIEPSTVAQLQDELWVTGPPVFMMMSCAEAPAGVEMPAASWEVTLDTLSVCLWGFPAGEEIAYEVYDAAGAPVAAGTTQTDEFLEGPSVAEVSVELGGQASGEWTVRAASSSAELETTIFVEVPAVTRLRAVPGPQVAADHNLSSLAAGDEVTITGSGMPANGRVALGVYMTEPGPDETIHYQLVFSGAVRTDGRGRFESVLTIEASDPPGDYCVVVPLRDGYEPSTEITADGATVCFTVAQ
jgi:hypothetical protein